MIEETLCFGNNVEDCDLQRVSGNDVLALLQGMTH
jgi:hypothetical protein